MERFGLQNKGARALGECAPRPRSKSNFPTQALPSLIPLFDENASNHLAIRAAYATSVEGGAEFTEEELEAAGLNRLRRPRWLHDRLKPNGYRRYPWGWNTYQLFVMEIGQFGEKLWLEVCLSVFWSDLAGAITNRGERMGCFGKMFLGWIGAFLGQLLFGAWGPSLNGTAITPSILGAMIFISHLLGKRS